MGNDKFAYNDKTADKWRADWNRADAKSAEETILRHKVITAMTAAGAAKGDIAKFHDVTSGSVSNWLNAGEFLEAAGVTATSSHEDKGRAVRAARSAARSMNDARRAAGLEDENGKVNTRSSAADILKGAAANLPDADQIQVLEAVAGSREAVTTDRRDKATKKKAADKKAAEVRGEALADALTEAVALAGRVGEVTPEIHSKIASQISKLQDALNAFAVVVPEHAEAENVLQNV